MRNMLEILGTLVAIGVFVFWCDVTDSWNNVFRWAKIRKGRGGGQKGTDRPFAGVVRVTREQPFEQKPKSDAIDAPRP